MQSGLGGAGQDQQGGGPVAGRLMADPVEGEQQVNCGAGAGEVGPTGDLVPGVTRLAAGPVQQPFVQGQGGDKA